MSASIDRQTLSHLDELESEAIHIMREVAAERERPVLLFSGGKDSIVLLRLAEKAFRPARFPFPVLRPRKRCGSRGCASRSARTRCSAEWTWTWPRTRSSA